MAPRAPRRSSRPAPAPADPPGHLVRTAGWAGLSPGDPVEVAGLRRARWAFVAHVRNQRTGDEWVEVVGGRSDGHSLRSFAVDRIFPAGGLGPADRSRLPPLADAPQLPL